MSPRHVFAFAVLIGWLLPAVAVAAGVPLADAAERGDLAAVRSLIGQGSDVNASRVDGTTALHAAVHADHLEIADLLLRGGANAGARDRYGVTPLYLACLNGNAEMIRRLLDAGADPDIVDPRRRDGADDGRAAPASRPRCALLLERGAARGRARAGIPADGADDRRARESSERPSSSCIERRRGGQRADAEGADAEVRAAVQGHRLRLGRRRHQSRRSCRIAAGAPK